MTLREQMATDLASVLNTDDFAEEFTYIPTAGPERTVVGDVVREVVDSEERGDLMRVETAMVTVARTAAGITQLSRGAKIRLSDNAVFTWTEKVPTIDDAAWVIEFKRADPKQLGG